MCKPLWDNTLVSKHPEATINILSLKKRMKNHKVHRKFKRGGGFEISEKYVTATNLVRKSVSDDA